MAVRDEISRLARDVLSVDQNLAADSIMKARYLIEKSLVMHRRPDDANEFYRQMLGDEYASMQLTGAEVESLGSALLAVLDGPPVLAARAAFALAPSARLDALAKLASLVERLAAYDGPAARQGIIAIADIVEAVAETGRALSPDEERWVDEACAALRFAEQVGVEDAADIRSAAANARDSISWWLRRPC